MSNWRAAKKKNLMMLNAFNARFKKRERTQNWSASEKTLLFELVKKYKDVVDNKNSTATQKNQAWMIIHKSFNESCETERNISRIKEQWGRMKAVAKLEMSSYNDKVEKCGLKEAEKIKPSELSTKIWHFCSEGSDFKPTDNESSEEPDKVAEMPRSPEQNERETKDKTLLESKPEERLSPTKEIEISEPQIKIENEEAEIPSFGGLTNFEEKANTTFGENTKSNIKQQENSQADPIVCKRRKVETGKSNEVTVTIETGESPTTPVATNVKPRIYVRGNLLKQPVSPIRIKPAQNRLLRIIPPPPQNKKLPTSTSVNNSVPLRLLLSKNVQQKIAPAPVIQQQTSRAATSDHDQIEQKKKIELLELQLERARMEKETASNELKISVIKREMIEREAAEKLGSQVKMTGERGSGVGKGGGGGGSIREAGGSFGKMEAANEDQYFYNMQKEQISKLREGLHDEISFHEEQIKRHQEAINRHKKRITDMEKE